MNPLDRTVASMMARFGTTGNITVAISEAYDPSTSENTVVYQDYPVNVMVFDYIRKSEGEGTQNNTLIKTGDKQVYVQPPQKTEVGIAMPHLNPNRDLLTMAGKTYKIVTVKQLNPSMTQEGCIVYELYIRE